MKKNKYECYTSLMYQSFAAEFAADRNNRIWPEWEKFVPVLKSLPPQAKVVDLGCGNGRLLPWLVNKIQGNWNYLGVDPVVEFKPFVIERLASLPTGISGDFTLGDFSAVPVKSHSVDIILAIASWHHVLTEEDLNVSEQELRRVLKPQGYFCFTVWNLFQPRLIWKYGLWSALWQWFNGTMLCEIPWKKTQKLNLEIVPPMRIYRTWTMRRLKAWWQDRGWTIVLADAGGNNHVLILQPPKDTKVKVTEKNADNFVTALETQEAGDFVFDISS